MLTLDIQLCGSFQILYNGVPVTVKNPERVQVLLAYLLLNRPAPQRREHLAFLLWPDSREGQARTNLRGLLRQLRQDCPAIERSLHLNGNTIYWLPQAACTSDVERFQHLSAQALPKKVDLIVASHPCRR